MLISRIKKIEENILIRDDPFDKFSDSELDEAALTLRHFVHSTIKDKDLAQEYKKLFIDNPTFFEMMTQTEKTNEEMLALLGRQRDWEIEHAELQKVDKEEVAEQYETVIKQFKFFRKL